MRKTTHKTDDFYTEQDKGCKILIKEVVLCSSNIFYKGCAFILGSCYSSSMWGCSSIGQKENKMMNHNGLMFLLNDLLFDRSYQIKEKKNHTGCIRICSPEGWSHSSSFIHIFPRRSVLLQKSAVSKWTPCSSQPQTLDARGLSPVSSVSYLLCTSNSVHKYLLTVNKPSLQTDILQSWPCCAANHGVEATPYISLRHEAKIIYPVM